MTDLLKKIKKTYSSFVDILEQIDTEYFVCENKECRCNIRQE